MERKPFLRRCLEILSGRGLAWIGLVVPVLLTLYGWHKASLELQHRARDRFELRAASYEAALIDRMLDYEQILKGAAALFAASSFVTRDEWRGYVEHLGLDTALPGIQATGFVLMVPRDRKVAHELAVREEGYPDYAIEPAGERRVYGAVLFVEPFIGQNRRTFGFDMYTDPVRRVAMDRARDTGQPSLTSKVKLEQETGVVAQPGFLMFLPVYLTGMPVTTVEERRAALLGFVYSPFRSFELLGSVFRAAGSDIEVEVFDGAPRPEHQLFTSVYAGRVPAHTIDTSMVIGGHRWNIRWHSSVSFEQSVASDKPSLILVGGLLLSALVFGGLYRESMHRHRLEAQVAARTRELVSARDDAQSANRAKSAFLASVSHELRTPLNAIIGFSSLLLEEPDGSLTDEQRQQLTMVQGSGRQLLELIRDILDVTTIEAGQFALMLEPVNLRGMLQEQCDSAQHHAHARNLELRIAAGDDSICVMADASRLRQVVHNLLENAIKFTDRGVIILRAARVGDMARVEISDTGVGIPVDEQAMLFDWFHRVADTSGRIRPGTGLGLSISRRLIEAMSGTIGVESEVERGSRFWFTLPLAVR